MYKGYEFKSGLDTFVQKLLAVSDKQPFLVYFKGSGAATNCYTTIYLPAIRDDAVLHRSKLERYCGYILHEWSHIQYTKNIYIENHHPNEGYVRQLWNALEDGWIEQKTINEGFVPNAPRLFTTLVEGIYREALDANIDWNDPRQWPFALAVWSRKYVTIRPAVAPEIAAIFDEAVSRPANHSSDNLEIAKWVYTQLSKHLEQNPTLDNPAPQQGEGEQGEGEQGEGESQGDGEQGASNGDLDKVTDPTAVEPTPEEHIESASEREKRESSSDYRDIAVPVGGEEVQPPCASSGVLYQPTATPARLRYELNRLFEGSAREQHNHGQRAGQVNVGALYRHSFDDAVFSRRQEEEGIDTALYILIDVSGSTSNRRGDRNGPTIFQAEFSAAHAIIDALRGANVQIAVDAFASYIAQIADWGAGIAKFKSNHAHAYGAAGSGTDDYAAVRHAHKRLLARPEKRKVLLVFTDGKGREDKVREQCEVGTNLGITTIGIGIGVNVGGVYPQSVYVDSISELASVSLKQIKLAA